MSKGNQAQLFRSVPTARVKAFIESYIETNYERDEGDFGYTQFAFDSGMNSRRVNGIRNEERPNVTFDSVDRMLTNLNMLHVWHLPKEDGGFADYYEPDIPPAPVEPNEKQMEYMVYDRALKAARKKVTA
jgi:hypothetical protein